MRRQTLRLGAEGEWILECRSVEVIERWAEANPGVHFSRPADGEQAFVTGKGGASAKTKSTNQKRLVGGHDEGKPASVSEAAAQGTDANVGSVPQPCKFWLNQGTCHKGDRCKYAHSIHREGQLEWIAERKRQRRLLSLAEGDPHGADVASKAHRAEKFAQWLISTFGKEALSRGTGVLDVAGGRGDVSFELHTKCGVPCTLVEPRPRKLNRHQHKWLKYQRKRENVRARNAQEDERLKVCTEVNDASSQVGRTVSNGIVVAGATGMAAGSGIPMTASTEALVPCVKRADPSSLETSGVLCAQVIFPLAHNSLVASENV